MGLWIILFLIFVLLLIIISKSKEKEHKRSINTSIQKKAQKISLDEKLELEKKDYLSRIAGCLKQVEQRKTQELLSVINQLRQEKDKDDSED
ncbi:hypothetical protein JZO66_14975 [Enterococcus sp. DIV0242_7C1]|uniref:Uncharacterized protein n=1 Tax=Candidatus Enterococcus dunnyi TaxID=1834192 RepID=A0A200JA30_9ENTE|nr:MULTISPECIES: hypothetical protein [unclassified Enterococcus]MBO0471860.1 hypothetical protein [Enterococcus sp. DIV0242_7C1]OUZ33457.1 hypothetical protein A5889_002170 [Enterococcus sp. 9D6_DIV0238]